MKKLHIVFLAALTATLMFSGCGSKKTEEPVEPVAVETPVQEVEEEPAEPVVEEPQEEVLPEGKKRSALTNEIVDEAVANSRPIAIMLPTDKSAQPQYGIGEAGILYECMEEGNMSRQMAIIEDWQNMNQLGNVRSSRDYYVYWALEWDSILVHFGGPYYLADIVSRSDVDNITGCAVNDTTAAPGAGAFYRTTDKQAPHNAYTSGAKLLEYVNSLEYSVEHRDEYFEEDHFTFAKEDEPNTLEGANGVLEATSVDLTPAFPYTQSALEYNATEGIYYKTLYGSAQKDGATGEQLKFENVIVQFTYHETRDAKGYLAFGCIDDQYDGYFITEGKAIHVNWKKTSDYEPTKYYDDNGNEVELNTGKTYIAIVESDDPVIINDVEYSSKTVK
ncbi:DUF3048 domain-containing protein [Konateibacter massiliensis]|uniref:DUF3048 domain-containing protein n=1 Tax=Konateibacter massiliensis TaxID=2002841 RepID=UPI000C14BFCC|nr:DUF3048 domain-containing protein [Konateibacter massiliensis]